MEQAAVKEMQAYQMELDRQKYLKEIDQRSHHKVEKIH